MLFGKPVVLALVAASLTFIFAGSSIAQDTVTKKPQKIVKIKVDMDEDGETVAIDTTFIIDEDFDAEKFQEAMKEYEIQMKDMGRYLKEMEVELHGEEMEKALQEAKFVWKEANSEMPRVRRIGRGAGAPHHLERFAGDRNCFYYGPPDNSCEPFRIRAPKRGESLSDLLGDIPMSAVKSYKIKETKEGKRIIIDVSDDALFDRDEEIIIWHGDGGTPPPPPPPPPPTMKKEIKIEKTVDPEEKTE